jgi:hypothetical protein
LVYRLLVVVSMVSLQLLIAFLVWFVLCLCSLILMHKGSLDCFLSTGYVDSVYLPKLFQIVMLSFNLRFGSL